MFINSDSNMKVWFVINCWLVAYRRQVPGSMRKAAYLHKCISDKDEHLCGRDVLLWKMGSSSKTSDDMFFSALGEDCN